MLGPVYSRRRRRADERNGGSRSCSVPIAALKTDIKRVDTHATGLPIYAYRYKGDPKHYPKV